MFFIFLKTESSGERFGEIDLKLVSKKNALDFALQKPIKNIVFICDFVFDYIVFYKKLFSENIDERSGEHA